MKRFSMHLALIAFAVALGLVFIPTKACGQEAKVLPNGSDHYGKSYGEWSAEWWKWAYSVPEDTNPIVDETGEYAAEGQGGDVWFLAGVWAGVEDPEVPVVRECTIPAGKALFFPLVNLAWITTPDDVPPGEDPWKWFPDNELWIRDLVAWIIGGAYDVWCTVDGDSLAGAYTGDMSTYRVFSPVFDVQFVEGNTLGNPKGKYGPSVGDGYYVMLAPLSEGPHTIEFFTAMPWPFDSTVHYQYVVYELEVVRGKQ